MSVNLFQIAFQDLMSLHCHLEDSLLCFFFLGSGPADDLGDEGVQ